MLNRIALILSIFVLPACTTLTSSKSDTRKGASPLVYGKTPIVQQTSGRNIMQKLDRDAWVGLRNSSRSEHIKLYATLGAGEWTVATLDARKFLQEHPQDEVALTVLAISLAMKQNYSLSAYYATLLNQYHPGNPEVHNLLGLATMNKPSATYDEYQIARHEFELAFDGSNQQIASGLNLAHLNLEMGNVEGARDVFQAVQDRCNNCTEATLGYGIALSRLRDFAKAEQVFTKVLKLEPHNAYARYYLALVAKYGRNDNKAAMSILTAMLEDPEANNIDMQRKANFLLRRIQAQVYGKLKDAAIATEIAPSKQKTSSEPHMSGPDLEQVINAE